MWIDYYLGYRAGHAEAYELLRLANELDIRLLYAVTSSKDLFYLISADYKQACRRAHGGKLEPGEATSADATAWGCLDHLAESATAVACDHSDVWLARKQRAVHGDYEDNLVVAAAQRAGADFLVTNDEKLLRHCPVAALDTRDAVAYLHAELDAADSPSMHV